MIKSEFNTLYSYTITISFHTWYLVLLYSIAFICRKWVVKMVFLAMQENPRPFILLVLGETIGMSLYMYGLSTTLYILFYLFCITFRFFFWIAMNENLAKTVFYYLMILYIIITDPWEDWQDACLKVFILVFWILLVFLFYICVIYDPVYYSILANRNSNLGFGGNFPAGSSGGLGGVQMVQMDHLAFMLL